MDLYFDKKNQPKANPHHQPQIVALPLADKRAAIAKLRDEYGVALSSAAGANTIAHEVARVLKVKVPLRHADSARMISAFAKRDAAPPQPVQDSVDRIEMLRQRFPFKPYVPDAAMERALARVAEFRAAGTNSDGGTPKDKNPPPQDRGRGKGSA